MAKRDYYEILSVTRTSTDIEIKAAYRKSALQYHPDRNPGNAEAEESFKLASEAYEVLSNAEKRSRYDRYGHDAVNSPGFQDVNDVFSSFGSIFEEFFGFSQGGGKSRMRRGADLRYDLAIEFEEAVFGVDKEIAIEKPSTCEPCKGTGAKDGSARKTCKTCGGQGQVRVTQGFFSMATTCNQCSGQGSVLENPCPGCRGEGQVLKEKKIALKIPAGVDTGLRLRVTNEGEPGQNNGPAGDLYVVLHVKESARYVRHELDLIVKEDIGVAQAILGCRKDVETLRGKQSLEIPAGTQHGTRLTIAGAGVPQIRGNKQGDLHVEVQVRIPRKLTKEQREIIVKFAELTHEDVDGENGGFFNRLFGD